MHSKRTKRIMSANHMVLFGSTDLTTRMLDMLVGPRFDRILPDKLSMLIGQVAQLSQLARVSKTVCHVVQPILDSVGSARRPEKPVSSTNKEIVIIALSWIAALNVTQNGVSMSSLVRTWRIPETAIPIHMIDEVDASIGSATWRYVEKPADILVTVLAHHKTRATFDEWTTDRKLVQEQKTPKECKDVRRNRIARNVGARYIKTRQNRRSSNLDGWKTRGTKKAKP
jgi:hypothetical protein